MPGLNVQVALSEALEVRGGPLTEREIWAVLRQAVESLQDLFVKGLTVQDQGPAFAVTPDTIMVSEEGFISFAESSFDSLRNKDYVPPEWNPRQYFTDEEVEKIFVFALGVSIYTSADFRLPTDQALNISDELDGLLGEMCEDDPTSRMNCIAVLNACSDHSQREPNRVPSRTHISRLYRLVLGSDSQLSGFLDNDNHDYVTRSNRSRRALSQERPQSAGPRSRSRSQPRSRSHSADRYSMFSTSQPRPMTLGHDQPTDPFTDHHMHHRKHPSITSLHSNKHYRGHHFVPPYFGSQPNLMMYDPYLSNAATPQYGGRKIVGQSLKGMNYHAYQNPYAQYGYSEGLPGSGGLIQDPSVREMYGRLKERQQKLQALRQGLELDGLESPDAMSTGSEEADRRSVISGHSYTHGAYQPDLYQQYKLTRAVRMGGQDRMEGDTDDSTNDEAWIRRQEVEINARQRAIEDFIAPRLQEGRQSRSRTKTPVGSRPSSRPSSRPNSRPGSRPTSRPNSRPGSRTRSEGRSRSRPNSRSKSRGERKVPNKTPRKYYGPEFIQSDRVIPVTVPTIKTTNHSQLRHVFVHLLNGEKLDLTCEHSTPGKDLYDTVVAHLGLPEHYLFGITYAQEGEYFFIEGDQRVSKVAPSHWKDPGKGKPTVPFTTYFRVKFYVENASVLQHQVTRHLFYLQLRKDMLEDKISCSEEQALTLAGLAMQAEYGDWYDKAVGFIPEIYLPPHVMKRLGKAYAKENIPKQHRKYCGLPDDKAELQFIKEVQKLSEYGIHFYKVYRKKKDVGNQVWTGISVQGILLAEQQASARVTTQRHPWQFTQKVSFSRKRFSITPKSDVGGMKLQKLNYYTDSYKKGRYLLSLSTAHHRFQIMMRQRIEPNLAAMIEEEYPLEAGDYDFEESEYLDDEDDEAEEEEYLETDETMDAGRQESYHDYRPPQYASVSRASNRTPRSSDLATGEESEDTLQNSGTDDGLVQHYQNVHQQERPRSRHSYKQTSTVNTPGSSRPASRPTTPAAHVIDVSFRSYDSSMELNQYLADQDFADIADPLFQSIENQSQSAAAPVERRVAIVELAKVNKYGIGLTIVGGENTGRLDLGIFVKSITPGGPADLHGNIQAGDRIIAINGQSLEGMPHHKAVELIRDAPDVVQLLISQPVEPYHGNGTLDMDSDASLMDDLNSPKMPQEFASYTSHNGSRDAIDNHTEQGMAALTLSQLNAVIQRTASVNSSDLELEDVVPPEALQPHYVETHKSPASPYINTEMYRQQAGSHLNGRLSTDYSVEGGRRSVDYSIEGVTKMSEQTTNRRTWPSDYQDGPEGSDDAITSTSRTDPSEFDRSYDQQNMMMSSPPESPSAQSSARTMESVEHLQPGEIYEIVLKKQNHSLGLNVAGGVNTTVRDGGIYVKSLAKKGAADLDQRIQVGDKVLEVNGVSLARSTHKQAVEALRSAPPVCHLLMEKGVPPSPKAASPQPSTTAAGTPSVQGGLSSVDTPSTLANNSIRTMTSPSLRSETTGTSVTMDTSITANHDTEEDVYAFVTPENTYAVELSRSSTGLGFSVLGGSDVHPDPLHCLVRVKKVFPHGPAHASGLQESDVILQVDNIKLRELTNKEVMTVLRSTPPTVRLIVCRPELSLLPSIEELRRSLLDNTMDSETNVPVAISTPTEDLILNERKPSFTGQTDQPSQQQDKPPTPIHSSHAYTYSDSESLVTPRESPDPTSNKRSLYDEELEDDSLDDDDETETECQTGRTETETRSIESESRATSSQRSPNRTPSPVKTFLQDAGLGSYETTPAATPSVEQPMNSARSGVSSSAALGDVDEAGDETGDEEEEMPSHVFEVTLTKGEKGLGFTVAGGKQTTGFFYVKDILYNPAKSDGRIQPGDRLIMVNGQDMTDLQHKEAVVYLRQTPQTVTLVFERQFENESADEMTPTPSPRISHVSPRNQDQQGGVKNLISSLETSGKQIIQPYQYKQSRQSPQSPGQLSPRETEANQSDKKTNLAARQATPRAPEDTGASDGENGERFEQQDIGVQQQMAPRVTVTVEENNFEDTERDAPSPTNPDDGYLLNTSRDDVMSTASSFGNVTLPLADLDESSKHEPEVKQVVTLKERAPTPEGHQDQNVVRIELKKPSSGSLGFTLVQGEKGLSSALFVRSIAPGSVAQQDGRLRINDKLLQVNGESVIGMAHNKAVALIKKAAGIVTLAISRSDPHPPSTRNTPAPTPSREVDRNEGEENIDTIDMEEQEGILQRLIKAVTPGGEKHADTDSDVDSATLDDTNDDWGSSPRSGKTATTFGDLDTDDSDKEEADKFNEGTNAYRNFMETKGGVKREEAPVYRGKVIEKENTEKALTRFNRIPSRLSDEWLATLDVISPPDNSIHYSDRELRNTLKTLKVKIERDDPVEEYKGLRHHKLTDNCIAARKPENKPKNRYRNVLPYDATRVCLIGTDDYINASHIRYKVSKNQSLHYIATQGPMPETTGDFWRMVWELKVEVIAMVTQDMEGGKVKCHRYWPDSMTTPMTILDRYEVCLCSVQCFEHFDLHQLSMTDTVTSDTHRVTHINFTTWPDHGTPDSGLPIMQYIKLMHLVHDSGPIVVHCSAGIGRTGALITLDIARALIDTDGKFDIQRIVQDLRRQRQGMIQTKDQYRFCYKTVMETLTTLNAGFMSMKSMGDTL